MSIKTRLYSVAVLGTLAVPVVSPVVAFAQAQPTQVEASAVEDWSVPTVVFGNALSEQQKQGIINDFGFGPGENQVVSAVVEPKDLEKYLGFAPGTVTSPLLSSVRVDKLDEGAGIKVKIADTSLIAQVSDEQYANAAVTAGLKDVQITIAAPSKVTGEAALAGVYKAVELNGDILDTKRTEVAQEELATVKDITQQLKEKFNAPVKEADGSTTNQTAPFDPSSLTDAVSDIKAQLAEHVEKNGGTASDETVRAVVKSALKAKGLDVMMTDEQVDALVDFALKYQDTDAVLDKDVLNQLGDISDAVSGKVSEALKAADEHGVTEKASGFFKDVWSAITGVFKKPQPTEQQ